MQKIYIKQFMAIQEAEIELENALLLIGEQASGKSTIAKLVYFFRSLREDLVYLAYEKIDSDDDLISAFRKKISTKFYSFFGSTGHSRDFEIKYFYSPEKHITLLFHPDKGLEIHLELGLYRSSFFQDVRTAQALQRALAGKDTEVSTQPDNILIVTVTKVETQAVLDVFSQAAGTEWIRQVIGKKTYYNLGTHGGAPVFMMQSEMGIATPGGALLTVRQAIQDLRPQAVIMCGVAFGLRPDMQHLGDILVAKHIQYYEHQKVDMQRGPIPRGDRVTSAERLLDRFRSGDLDWQGAPSHFGLILSGETLINDPNFRNRLLEIEPEAIGGEMEGAGLYAAAHDAKVDWILVKSICDWADGEKNNDVHSLAANNAAQFILHVLQLGGWGESEQQFAYERVAFQVSVRKLTSVTNELLEDSRVSLFIPAGRNITVSYPEQFKLDFYGGLRGDLVQTRDDYQPQSADLHLMVKFLEQTERVKARFDYGGFQGLIADKLSQEEQVDEQLLGLALDKINKILKAEYSKDQSSEKLFYDGENFVRLNKASSGQQEVIRILQDAFLVLLDRERAFRVIEEPEAHLYPMAQKHLIEMIAMMLNSTDSQIIITTHSPYILSIFNNLLFATRVVNKDEKVRGQVDQIIPESCRLDPEKCNVYFLKDGSCKSIFNPKLGLIGQNHLDEISEELGADFNDLYHIYGELLK